MAHARVTMLCHASAESMTRPTWLDLPSPLKATP